jgi:hypothetical protein
MKSLNAGSMILAGEVRADALEQVGRVLAVDVVVHDARQLDRLELPGGRVDLLELVRLHPRCRRS